MSLLKVSKKNRKRKEEGDSQIIQLFTTVLENAGELHMTERAGRKRLKSFGK